MAYHGAYRNVGYRKKNVLLWILLGACLLSSWPARSAPVDEVTPIEAVTVNPAANNRRAVILQGNAKAVSVYRGEDSFGRTICGQGFTLEDGTGSIEVLYLVRCQATETPVLVGEGERVTVHATIDGSPTNLTNAEGKEVVIKAMATKIIRGTKKNN